MKERQNIEIVGTEVEQACLSIEELQACVGPVVETSKQVGHGGLDLGHGGRDGHGGLGHGGWN